jgi:transcription initiation factor TFIIB
MVVNIMPKSKKHNIPVLNSTKCSLCNSESIITDAQSAELVCSQCGLVISDKIQEVKQESQNFHVGEPSRYTSSPGMPTSLARPDMGLSTVISSASIDASGHEIDPCMLTTIHRLRTWDYRTKLHSSLDKNLSVAFTELHSIKDKLGLTDSVAEKAAYIYRKAQERGFTRGRSISAIITAAAYIACRQAGLPKTLKEVADANNLRSKATAKAYRLIVSELNMRTPVLDPIKCIAKISNKAALSEKTKRQAIEIMNDIVKKEISAGKNPMGLAATVLYITCTKTGQNKPKKDIAQAAGITEVTLRNGFKNIRAKLQLN